MSIRAGKGKDIRRVCRTVIGMVRQPFYCRILATGHSMRIGVGHSSSVKYVKNLKRLWVLLIVYEIVRKSILV